ncbi:SocA family protein [Campylobacter sp. RM12640]|uniref:Panacea domain-containing protein n=1 Tax=unclassified Campylobacter TaxID=2593542 RepID=UPI003014AF50|nr:SocA family protein [Campylobacter sp. RM12640]MBZ7989566.1 SocA family protein [Campylobacter sp. RM12635]
MFVKNAIYYARQVIGYCNNHGYLISNLQLQKILYFLQMQNFKYNEPNMPLFDDDFVAYPYGPIIHEVYSRYSIFASGPIQDYVDDEIWLSDNQIRLIEACLQINPWKLVDMSHKIGGAWDITYKNRDGIGNTIEKDLIYKEARGL